MYRIASEGIQKQQSGLGEAAPQQEAADGSDRERGSADSIFRKGIDLPA
jgi:hypothetical protein